MCHSPHNTPGGSLHQQVMFTPRSSDHATAQKSETRVFFFRVFDDRKSECFFRYPAHPWIQFNLLTTRIRMALHFRISNWNLQFVQGYLCWYSLRLGNLTGSHLEKLDSTNFCPGGFGKSSRWNRRNGQGRVCLCMLRHFAKFSLQQDWPLAMILNLWIFNDVYIGNVYISMHIYKRGYTVSCGIQSSTSNRDFDIVPPEYFQIYFTIPLEEETTEATSRKSWVQSKIKKQCACCLKVLCMGKTRHWLSKTRVQVLYVVVAW